MGKSNIPVSRNADYAALFTQSVYTPPCLCFFFAEYYGYAAKYWNSLLHIFFVSVSSLFKCPLLLQVHVITTQTNPCMCLGAVPKVAAMLPLMIYGDWTWTARSGFGLSPQVGQPEIHKKKKVPMRNETDCSLKINERKVVVYDPKWNLSHAWPMVLSQESGKTVLYVLSAALGGKKKRMLEF